MKFLFSTRHWAAASWILTLAACSSDTSRSASIQIAENQQKSSAEIQWVQSPQKHNNSGIAMRYRLEGALKVGQPVTLILEFSGANAQDAQFNISMPKGLSMVGSQGMQKSNQAYRSALKINEVNSQALTITPSSEGEHFVSIQLMQNGQQSAAGVMLRVGDAPAMLPTTGERVTSHQGEKLIIMPAK